jgi:hypothetical protein
MEKKKRGRKPLSENDKVMLVSVYIKKEDKIKIVEKYGSVTMAIKEEIIPKLNTPKLANL